MVTPEKTFKTQDPLKNLKAITPLKTVRKSLSLSQSRESDQQLTNMFRKIKVASLQIEALKMLYGHTGGASQYKDVPV